MTSDNRPVLVGMNNPYGTAPEHALYPLPERATGWRIWRMVADQVPRFGLHDYADGFDRRNLQVGPWVQGAARACALAMRSDLAGRTVVLFGAKVRDAFLDPKAAEFRTPCGRYALENWATTSGRVEFTYLHWVPHPSGLNQWYNDEANRARVGRLLARLHGGERGLLDF